MNDNEQVITKYYPSLDDQIIMVLEFETKLKEQLRHVAEMLEREMTDYIGAHNLDQDVHDCLMTLVAAAEETQINLNAYFSDACVGLLRTQEQRDTEQEEEEEARREDIAWQRQVSGDYNHAIRI